MHRRNIDILIVVIITVVACAMILAGTSTILRVGVGLPLALFLPGYALTAIIPPNRSDKAERVLFSFGLSIGILIISGLVLNITPWGLHAIAWTIVLSAITLIGCGVAAFRRRPATDPLVMTPFMPHFRELLGFGVAACILVGAVGVARAGAAQQSHPGFTQLWILPDAQGAPGDVRLGMLNVEQTTTTYEVRLVSKGTTLYTWSALTLAPGQRWETIVVLQDDIAVTDKLEAVLYRSDAPDVIYRHVSYWREQEQP